MRKLLITTPDFKKEIECLFIKGKPCISLGKGIYARGLSKGIASGLLNVYKTRENKLIGYGINDEFLLPVDEHMKHELDNDEEKVSVKLESKNENHDKGEYEEIIETFPSLVKIIDSPKLKNIYKETLDAVEDKLEKDDNKNENNENVSEGIQASSYPQEQIGEGIYARGLKKFNKQNHRNNRICGSGLRRENKQKIKNIEIEVL